MNYYNPYFYTIPTQMAAPKVGLLSKIFGKSGVTLGGILNGTQRVLNFANQAIPLVKQVRPMIGNAKTMFKVMNEFKRSEKPKTNNPVIREQNVNSKENSSSQETNYNQDNITTEINNYDNGPTFFM